MYVYGHLHVFLLHPLFAYANTRFIHFTTEIGNSPPVVRSWKTALVRDAKPKHRRQFIHTPLPSSLLVTFIDMYGASPINLAILRHGNERPLPGINGT